MRFANRATRLVGGRSRATMVAAAFVAVAVAWVAVAWVAGMLLASRAEQWKVELQNSQFVAQFAQSGEGGRIAQMLIDPRSSDLLLQYINAMATVLVNLEQTPQAQLAQFEALFDAQAASGGRVTGMRCDGAPGPLVVSGTGDAAAFLESISASGAFSRVQAAQSQETDGQEFTIQCYFSDQDL